MLVFAHGNSNVHTSGNYREDIRPFGYEQNSGGVGWVHGYDEMRSLHMGTGLPPFNTSYNGTLMPPTNLFWLYSCHPVQEPEFHRILFPYWNAFSILSGNVCENQSYVGFTTFVRLTLEPAVRALQCLLTEGRTIYATRLRMRVDNLNEDLPNFVKDNLSDNYRAVDIEDMPIRGDHFTRLKGVYTGENTISQGWYR